MRLAFQRRGMGPFHAVDFPCALSLTEVDPVFCVSLLPAVLRLKSWRKGKGEGLEQQPQAPANSNVKWQVLLWCLQWCALGFSLVA